MSRAERSAAAAHGGLRSAACRPRNCRWRASCCARSASSSSAASAPTRCRAARRSARRSLGRWRSARSSILADEPVASLDPEAAEEIMRLLRQLATEGGLAVLCVLHQPALALRYSHRVVGLRDGVVAFDLPADLRRRPADRAALQGARRMSVDGTTLAVARASPRADMRWTAAARRRRSWTGRSACASSLGCRRRHRRAGVLCRAGAAGGPGHRRPRHGRHHRAAPCRRRGRSSATSCGRRWRRSTSRSSAPCSAC